MAETIYIQDFMPSIIVSRKAISYFEDDMKLKNDTSYIFDFSNITFISRSLTDELINYFKAKNIAFELRNTKSNIEEIFKAVQKNRSKRSRSYHEIAITSFDNRKDLTQFLYAI